MKETVVVSAARTPFGRLGGGLGKLEAVEMGGIAIREAVSRSGIEPGMVDYLYMGHVLQGGCGQVPSRQAGRNGGLPWEVPSLTVNKVCASGLASIGLADARIRLGKADIVVAGGMESMSNAPFYTTGMRWGNRMGDTMLKDLMLNDGLWCAFHDRHMAVLGSEVAEEYGVSRGAQDEWALRSQRLACDAMANGRLNDEIVPVTITTKKGDMVVDQDEAPRMDTSMEGLTKLAPVFTKDGTVTAGNAPGVNDGACAMVLMSREKAVQLNVKPLATIVDTAEVSQEARYIPTVPGLAIQKLLDANELVPDDIALYEINEAFAAVALISTQIANVNRERVNIDGGAIAFGHPIGASGARILAHLIYALRRRGGGLGVVAICSGAAQGDAMLVRVDDKEG